MCVLPIQETKDRKNIRHLISVKDNKACEVYFSQNLTDEEFATYFVSLAKEFDAIIVGEHL